MRARSYLLLVSVVVLLGVVSGTKINPCQTVATLLNPSSTPQFVFCDNPYADDANCRGRCCLSSGFCHSSSCVDVWRSTNNNCGDRRCLAATQCLPLPPPNPQFQPPCSASGNVHCVGILHCLNGACAGFGEGDRCLYDGNSKNYKICRGAQPCPACSLCLKYGIVHAPFTTQINDIPAGATVTLAWENGVQFTLPPGLVWGSTPGQITGTPTQIGDFVFDVDVNSNGVITRRSMCPIHIRPFKTINCETDQACLAKFIDQTPC